MIIKHRQPSVQLLQLRHLNARTNFDLTNYDSDLKGYYGEQLLDDYIRKIDFGNAIVIEDIRLLDGNMERQFDTLVIVNQCVYILDAKFYLKDARLTDDKFYHGNKLIEHPNLQIGRSETFLQNFIWKHFRLNVRVVGYFVFVNQQVQLRNDDQHPKLLKVTELSSLFQEIKHHPVFEEDYDIAEGLVNLHRKQSIHVRPLELNNVTFYNGLKCPKCWKIHHPDLTKLMHMPCCGEIFTFNDVMHFVLSEYCTIYDVNQVKTQDICRFITGEERRNFKIERFLRENLQATGKRGEYIYKR
ncbi:nuclease-related domain-containing protein [Macrococcus capreoli]|uniref:nuclease-related domain-containing protein n=1 Tax=Macrococcus capreoli TaxID=2982690 RepID=UPI003EE73270